MDTTKKNSAVANMVKTELIDVPNHFRAHTPEMIEALANDIKAHGMLQEVVLAAKPDGRFELVAGNGRLQAVQKLGWTDIWAQSFSGLSELDKAMIAISENEAREDVNPFDRARSYARAMKTGNFAQKEFAQLRGMLESDISSHMVLLDLPVPCQEKFERSNFSMGQLRHLVRIKDPEQQLKMAEECIKQDLSVKALSAKVDKLLGKPEKGPKEGTEPQEKTKTGFTFKQKGSDLIIQGRFPMEGQTSDRLAETLKVAFAKFVVHVASPGKEVPAEPINQAA